MSSDRDARARRVLVVDDEAMMLDMISAVLADWAEASNTEVLVASSAAEALAAFERLEGAVDLIISDLIMPGGNGSDLLLEVRRRWPEVATMIVSGASDVEQMRRVTTAGIFAYLVKPFDPAVLIAEADKALEIALLRRENRRHEERLRGELAWAGELQRALLRPDLPPDPRFALSVAYLPLAELQCGGDFYAVLGVSADRRQFLIGDVGGHGIRAALVTALLKALVAPSPESVPPSPGELLGRLNRRLCETLKDTPELLVTFLACEVDASSRTLVYSGAGHLPLYVLRGDEALAFPSGGTGLGFDPATRFEERTVVLEPADRLVLYTDGVRECVPGEPAEAERAFSRLLLASRRETEFAPAVIAWVKRLAGRDAFADDATVLGVTIG